MHHVPDFDRMARDSGHVRDTAPQDSFLKHQHVGSFSQSRTRGHHRGRLRIDFQGLFLRGCRGRGLAGPLLGLLRQAEAVALCVV